MEQTQFFNNCTQSALPPGLDVRFNKNRVAAITFSPDGTRLAAGGDGRIWIYDVTRGVQFAMLSGHTDRVRALAFTPDNGTLVSGGEDRTLRLWDIETAQETSALTENASNLVNALASSPDGVPLSGWHEGTGRFLAALTADPGQVRALAFGPDGTVFASGGTDGKIRVWDLETGHELLSISAHDGLVLALAFSPDGKHLASGGSDAIVRLWELDSKRLLSTLTGHRDSINALAFSIEGGILASGGRDDSIRVWDAHAQNLISTLPVQAKHVWELAFWQKEQDGTATPINGQQLGIVGRDGTFFIVE